MPQHNRRFDEEPAGIDELRVHINVYLVRNIKFIVQLCFMLLSLDCTCRRLC